MVWFVSRLGQSVLPILVIDKVWILVSSTEERKGEK